MSEPNYVDPNRFCVLAVDPGASGGIATFDGTVAWCMKMPDDEASVVGQIIDIVDVAGAHRLVIENTHAMPKGGVNISTRSAHAFGYNRGIATAALLATRRPLEKVLAAVWQRGLGVTKGIDYADRKRALCAIAKQRFPSCKVTLSTCDALLIAEWAWLKWNAARPSTSPPPPTDDFPSPA